ncbi:uncharacterized protein LOC121738457 [Aricia agestis]|uniref:uncharacterized protein LOC121738457 n=1 Tax=Aricia agestis TaxID=91739 RepID=UPI001C20BDC7|nr:uncharacterized protein LOC121738457 [Aricia agestis]
MIQLNGINLGQRHYELNKKVDELFTKKENFEKVSASEEKSDVERLLKIDLANLHKNLEYLANTLKCGDPLYISRALKCTALFEDHVIINPEYLHSNIIPFMSQKMKRKMLTAIAMHVKDQERVDSFYQYCINHKLNAIANKFVINASQLCKEEYLKSHIDIDDSIKFELFFGNCYDLIDRHMKRKKLNNYYCRSDLFRFSYLFSSSSEKYLNLLEEYLENEKCTYYNSYTKFGLRMSKIIMKKHKQRVFDKPWLYLGALNKSMITRYTSSDDAKKFAVALLPDRCKNLACFWSDYSYENYAFFLKKIPNNEIYAFLKQIFASKYPNEIFEMNFSFYRLGYHKLMTSEERHEWALKHIEQKKEHFGPLKDYKWYKFVKFNKAFFEIKKLIYVNKSAEVRSDLINVLVESASQEDVEDLLKYYYERHVNESTLLKENFLNKIIETHNVYKFDEKCWTLFMKLLHSLEAFTLNNNSAYTIIAVLYNIIKYKTIPENLETFCTFGRSFPGWINVIDKLDSEEKELVFNYLREHFANKIKQLMDTDSENLKKEEVKKEIVLLIWSTKTLIHTFNKSKSDFPEIAMKGVKLYWDEFSYEGWRMADMGVATLGQAGALAPPWL